MTLSLYVLRHAKAARIDHAAGDHDRPLERSGRADAETVGRFLARIGEIPGLVLSSSALRAVETAELAGAAGRWEAPLVVRAELYQASGESLLRAVAAVERSPERLLLIGHQPALSLLIAGLIAGREPAFPAAALARIDVELDRWSAVCGGAGQLQWLVTPALCRRLHGTR